MRETMSISGGLDMYGNFGSRYDSDVSPEGRKVIFLNKNGWDGETDDALKYFEEGQVLTVKEIYVSRSSSTVKFMEVPDKEFNPVMFADVE